MAQLTRIKNCIIHMLEHLQMVSLRAIFEKYFVSAQYLKTNLPSINRNIEIIRHIIIFTGQKRIFFALYSNIDVNKLTDWTVLH